MFCGCKKVFNQIWNVKSIILICYAIFAMTMAVEVGFRTVENKLLTSSGATTTSSGSGEQHQGDQSQGSSEHHDPDGRRALNIDLASTSTIGMNWGRRLMTNQINDFQRRYMNDGEEQGGEEQGGEGGQEQGQQGEDGESNNEEQGGEGGQEQGQQGEDGESNNEESVGVECEVYGKGTITYTCNSATDEESFLIPIMLGTMIALPGVLLFLYVICYSGAWGAEFGTFEYVIALVEVRKRKCFKFFVWFGILGICGFTGFMIHTEMEDGETNGLIIQILIQNTITILLAWGEMYTPNSDVLELKKISDQSVLGLRFNFSMFSTAENCMEYIEDGIIAILISDNYLPLLAVGVTKSQAQQMIKAIGQATGSKKRIQMGPGGL